MQKRLLPVMVVAVALALFLAGCGQKVVATVNGEEITQQELDKEMEMYKAGLESQGADFSGQEGKDMLERLSKDVLKQMIEERLLMQEVRERGLEPSGKEVSGEITKIKEGFESEGQFKKFLAANGLSEPQLNDYVEKQLAVQNLINEITKDIQVSREDVEQYYRDNKDSYTTSEKRKVRHILIGFKGNDLGSERSQVDAKIEAMRLLEKINGGADFIGLAEENSEDSQSSGGLLTVTRGGGFVKEFEDAAFTLKEGEVTREPVKTRFGYHIIKLEEIVPARVAPLAEVEDRIKTELENTRRTKEFTDYVDGLKEKATINNKLSNKNDKSTKK